MDSFQKELNELLIKYPELPEFTLTVRPRVTISIKRDDHMIPSKTFVEVVPVPSVSLSSVPVPKTSISEMNKMISS